MPKSLLIQKTGKVVEKQFRDIKEETLHKKCGFSNNSNFTQIYSCKCPDGKYIHLYGKTKGGSNAINKIELPPPIDNTIFYGSILVLATPTITVDYDAVLNYSIQEWEKDYEAMFGGFEDINSESESEKDSLDDYPDDKKTQSGYMKDDFVVDSSKSSEDGESEEEGIIDSELDEEEYSDSDDED